MEVIVMSLWELFYVITPFPIILNVWMYLFALTIILFIVFSIRGIYWKKQKQYSIYYISGIIGLLAFIFLFGFPLASSIFKSEFIPVVFLMSVIIPAGFLVSTIIKQQPASQGVLSLIISICVFELYFSIVFAIAGS